MANRINLDSENFVMYLKKCETVSPECRRIGKVTFRGFLSRATFNTTPIQSQTKAFKSHTHIFAYSNIHSPNGLQVRRDFSTYVLSGFFHFYS